MSATPGTWEFEPGDNGDDSVGIAPTPPFVFSVIDDGDPVPVCMMDEPERRSGRAPVDEFDECRESFGTLQGNAALICAAPALLAALEQCVLTLGDLPSTNIAGTRTRKAFESGRFALAKARA